MIRRVLEALSAGSLLLAAIQFPGAVFDYFIRSDIGPPEVLMGVILGLAGATLVLRLLLGAVRAVRFRALDAAIVAVGLGAGFAQIAPLVMRHAFVEVSDLGIVVPAPGRRDRDCRGVPRRCHDHVRNELGFRGALARRSTPDAKLVAVIGDSFVFGSGVGDDDTVPAALARELSDITPSVAVVNAGIEGLAAGSFPGVVRYVRSRLDPDLIVVLVKDDDLDDTDLPSRWNRFRQSFAFRLLYVANLEPVFETGRQAWRALFDRRDRARVLAERLGEIASAADGARLLLVTAFAEDLRPAVADWLARHPDVQNVSSWDDPRYERAERIPHDGHWTEAGCRDVASAVAPAVRRELATANAAR